MSYRHPVDRPGLQGERTELAWERTALGLFAAAALLLVHDVGPSLARVVVVVSDLAMALLMIGFGRRRGRRIRALRGTPDGRSAVPAAGVEIVVAGVAAAVLAVGTGLILVLRA